MKTRERRIVVANGGWVGVDPGFSSGCISYVSGNEAMSWPLKDMTFQEIFNILEELRQKTSTAVLERVGAMPGQGVSSMFKFGQSYGALQMGLAATGYQFTLVVPQKWQGALGCRTGGNKTISRDFAQRMFPAMRVTNTNADSILLAVYGSRFLKEHGR